MRVATEENVEHKIEPAKVSPACPFQDFYAKLLIITL
jgi:hypothetical protein